MKKLKIDLENCYGIKRLEVELDFTECKACAIYAPNGAMKSSLANTFQDLSEAKAPRDRFFPARKSNCVIADESGAAISADEILVVRPYDEAFSHSTKTSALLVNSVLREEYEKLHADIDATKASFLKMMKDASGSKRDLAVEISSAFTASPDQFYRALTRVKDEVKSQTDTPFKTVKYDTLFDEKGLAVLETKDFKTAIETYIKKYNELIDASTYFKRGTFNYYNAGQIAKNLAENGFFKALHSINLKGGETVEISTEKELEALVQKEKDAITNDAELKKTFDQLAKLLEKNADARGFEAYISEHEDLLPHLSNIPVLRQEVWKSYFKAHEELYLDLIAQHQATEKRRVEIEAAAASERTQWQDVIDIFNDRFSVPFKLAPKNLIAVTLAQEAMLALDFSFEDGGESVRVERKALMDGLSTGERKAFYLLNVLFEIEVRRKATVPTIIIVDDVADSFDYKNKYAIVQYLAELADDGLFRQIILTHNFDFFRTVNSRFVKYGNCYMGTKNSAGVALYPAKGIKNIFVKDWKLAFFTDEKKRIASIPFIRNLVEFTTGETDPTFHKLTALLHVTPGSDAITQGDLDQIYNGFFGGASVHSDPKKSVFESIREASEECLKAADGANFENKIVLAIGVRLAAEKYMIANIVDKAFIVAITSNQTSKLLSRFKKDHPGKTAEIKILERVALMTPENIHLNSFMYEPILDMSDEHLRKLYADVIAMK